MTNHSKWCIKEPDSNCVNCYPTCSNCEKEESEDDMSDTPRTDALLASKTEPITAVKEFMRTIERELNIEKSEKLKYRERAWKAESQLDVRYGLRKEINAELGLTDETGDDALRKGIETIKALKAECDAIKQIEQAARDAMRAGIVQCSINGAGFEGCKSVIAPCRLLTYKTCPLRAYLASKNQPDAWEVK